MKLFWYIFALLCTTGCAAKFPQADDSAVKALVQKRIAKEVHWNQEGHIEGLLDSELTLDACVQIALLNNPSLQATFEELGIAQADLWQAGLFQNPLFQGFVRFPDHRHIATNTEISIQQSFLEFFLIPLRTKIAKTEVELAELRVANAILKLAFDVEEVYFRLQAEENTFPLLQLLAEEMKARALLAHKQLEVGNINDLEAKQKCREYLDMLVRLSRSKKVIISFREELNRLMGGTPSQSHWRLAKESEELPQEDMQLTVLEEKALHQRLDLLLARLEIKHITEIGASKQWWAYTDPMIGISGEREIEGPTVIGPALSFAFPLCDHGQADRARLFSLLKQSQHSLEARKIDVLVEVKQAHEELQIAKRLTLFYAQKLVPLHKEIVRAAEQQYAVMGLGVYQLLQEKKQELEAKIGFIESLRDYRLTKVKLARAIGGTV